MKKTPWYPPEIKPVHKGVYERKQVFGIGHSYWDGKRWLLGYGVSESVSKFQHKPWRGLARKPK